MKSFAFEKFDSGQVLIQAEFVPLLQQHGLTTFDSWMNYQGGQAAKHLLRERRTTRIQLVAADNTQQVFYLKRHFPSSWREYVKPLLHGRWPLLGARNEWNALLHFHAAGVPTMTPVAFSRTSFSLLFLGATFFFGDRRPGRLPQTFCLDVRTSRRTRRPRPAPSSSDDCGCGPFNAAHAPFGVASPRLLPGPFASALALAQLRHSRDRPRPRPTAPPSFLALDHQRLGATSLLCKSPNLARRLAIPSPLPRPSPNPHRPPLPPPHRLETFPHQSPHQEARLITSAKRLRITWYPELGPGR